MAHSENLLRRSQLIKFDYAAAGHDGVLTNATQSIFVKPCKRAEIDFYLSAEAHPHFASFIPEQLGALTLRAEQDTIKAAVQLAHSRHSSRQLDLERITSASSRPESPWIPSGGGKIETNDAIVLENVTFGFKKPNVLDVKLGARLWADDAPSEKRKRLDKAAAETTSKALGFRLAGMRTWRGDDPDYMDKLTDDGFKVYDKVYGRSLTEATIRRGFEEYFQLGEGEKAERGRLIRRVINRMIAELEALRDVLEQEESRMYSASLLFIYEGDVDSLRAALRMEKVARQAMEQATHQDGSGTADGDLTASQVLTDIEPHVLRAIHAANLSPSTPHHPTIPNHGDMPRVTGPLVLSAAADVDTDEETAGDPIVEELLKEDEEESSPPPQKTTVLKLIDFAHAQWTPGQGPDENLLHGIRNVITVLETLVDP